MRYKSPFEELTAIQGQIRRLQARESVLAQELGVCPMQGIRPGWPIRRVDDLETDLH